MISNFRETIDVVERLISQMKIKKQFWITDLAAVF